MGATYHGAPEHIHHREDEAFYNLEGEFDMSLLAEERPPDLNKMKELTDKYEIEFLLPPR